MTQTKMARKAILNKLRTLCL